MATIVYIHFAVLFCFTFLYQRVVDARITVYDAYNETVDEFSDIEVPYGSDLIVSIKGLVALAEPFDACTPIREAFNSSVFASFALIYGNVSADCPGGLKVLHAQKAGFDAVIMFGGILPFGGVTSKDLFLKVSTETIIPALIVEYKAGVRIMNNYIFKKTNGTNFYWFKLTPNSQDISYYIMLFSVVIGICFMIMLLFMICLLIKCIRERRRSRRNRLSSRQIRQLGTEKFTAGDQYDTCAICLEEYREGEKLRILPCAHVYHMKCIDPWLLNNRRTCPLCKRKIRIGDSDSVSSSDSDVSSLHASETSPLIPSGQSPIDTGGLSVQDWLMQRQEFRRAVTDLLHEADQHYQDAATAENGSCTNPLTDAHCSGEVVVSHQPSSTYGSVNNSDGEEFVDALTPGETSTSSAVHV